MYNIISEIVGLTTVVRINYQTWLGSLPRPCYLFRSIIVLGSADCVGSALACQVALLSCRQSCSNVQYYGRISFNFLYFLVILARTDALASCLPIDATVVFFEGQNKGPAAICVRESGG